MRQFGYIVTAISTLTFAGCDTEPADDGVADRAEKLAPDEEAPVRNGPFCLPDGSISTDQESGGSEAVQLGENVNLLAHLAVENGSIDFVDRASAISDPEGGVAVIAVGEAASQVGRLMEEKEATALEVYLAFGNESPPERLVEDHDMAAANLENVPATPRDLVAESEVFRAYDIDTLNGECPSNFSFSYWKTGYKSWSSSYGNQVSCASVEVIVDITTWSSAKRSIGACYHDCDGCSSAGATITFYGWNGTGWTYFAGPYGFSGSPNYGQAVYYGVSAIIVGQDQGRVRNVESNEETIYVGARSQIGGGQDQC